MSSLPYSHTHTQSQNSPILLVEGEERERGSVVEDPAAPAEEEDIVVDFVHTFRKLLNVRDGGGGH